MPEQLRAQSPQEHQSARHPPGGRPCLPAEPSAPALVIRPIEPGDKPMLAEGFSHLSLTSRYRRFLEPHTRLTPSELRYLTEVDHRDHEALVAVDPDSGAGVGVARYIRSECDLGVAEFAIAVADERQGEGVGHRLADALAERAREAGVTTFTALAFADNKAVLELLRSLGDTRVLSNERGVVELSVELPRNDQGANRA